jgi:hypothetical protein
MVALLVVALGGCRRADADTRDTNSSPTKPAAVATTPPPASPAVPVDLSAKVAARLAVIDRLSGKLPPRMARASLHIDGGKTLGETAEFIQAEDMSDLTKKDLSTESYRLAGSAIFLTCARIVRKHDTSVSDARKLLERCAGAEFLVVIRHQHFTRPQANGGGTFTEGKVDGDVLVYSLPGGKLLGGFPYAAKSSDQAGEQHLDQDLQDNWARAMRDGLEKLQPRATLPFGF